MIEVGPVAGCPRARSELRVAPQRRLAIVCHPRRSGATQGSALGPDFRGAGRRSRRKGGSRGPETFSPQLAAAGPKIQCAFEPRAWIIATPETLDSRAPPQTQLIMVCHAISKQCRPMLGRLSPAQRAIVLLLANDMRTARLKACPADRGRGLQTCPEPQAQAFSCPVHGRAISAGGEVFPAQRVSGTSRK